MPVLARAVLALFIASLLTFAPFKAAQASYAAATSQGMDASHGVPDCHGAKHEHGAPAGHDCCDHGSKSQCPDSGCGCAFGCGIQTLAAFYSAGPVRFASAERFETPKSAAPPNLRPGPPGPPPKS
jgi:hypothetical protein